MHPNSNDISITLKLSLEEVYSGITKHISYKRIIKCSSCNAAKDCRKCQGKGLVLKEVKEPINIPQGVDEGMVLKFRGKGNHYFESKAVWYVFSQKKDTSKVKTGDLIIQIESEKHPVFERRNSDLIYRCDLQKSLINVTDVTIEFNHLDEEYINIKIPQNTQNGKVFRIKGKGFKNLADNSFGNLLIAVNVTND
jgi:molecular chaperone DnaJ